MGVDLNTNVDFLKGNICRLVVTNDLEELTAMYAWASRRLNEIYFERRKELDSRKRI